MDNRLYLGIELGSTRIKAVAIDGQHQPVAGGDYGWESTYENGVWTYPLERAWEGVNAALSGIDACDRVAAVGISGMMHGYLAFDKDWNLLVPFRTWQNTITARAAEEMTARLGFNIPQRWSAAHLYQAVLNKEAHISRVAHITTLAGYIHYRLTGVNAVGIGEASGIFPIDSERLDYDEDKLAVFADMLAEAGVPLSPRDVLPAVLSAGEDAGALTQEGAALLHNRLAVGTPFAPPEGDAGTGMTATNAVAARTGNVSAGTSVFAMVVLERPLSKVYREIDMVTTPAGKPVAMVHCNNCTNDSNKWVGLFREVAALFGAEPDGGEVYEKLYRKSLEGDPDAGGVLVCNYIAGEGITDLDEGRPLVTRRADSRFTLANFFRATLYATLVTLKIGMEILTDEQVTIDSLTGHGGLFKTPAVGQRYLAAACNTPVTCMQTAGEGGPYGMALLTAYRMNRTPDETLEDYLQERVFAHVSGSVLPPDPADVAGFDAYTQAFKGLLQVEQSAIEHI